MTDHPRTAAVALSLDAYFGLWRALSLVGDQVVEVPDPMSGLRRVGRQPRSAM